MTAQSIPDANFHQVEGDTDNQTESKVTSTKDPAPFWSPMAKWEGMMLQQSYKGVIQPNEETKLQPQRYQNRSKYSFDGGKVINVREPGE